LERCAIWTIRPDGTHARQITPDGVVADGVVPRPSWSPDSKSLVFTRLGRGLMRVHVQTRALRWLTRANDDEPVWSPNGKTIAFVRAVDDLSDYGYQLFRVRADGRRARRLTNKFRGTEAPSWSPDGTRIAFAGRVSTSRACGERGGAAIFSLTVGDHSLRRLSAYAPDWTDTAWSPDGSRVAARRMSCSPNAWWNLYVINEAGGLRRPVGRLDVGGPIAWRPAVVGSAAR
jgi:Tol biopolymer transport system component